MQKSNICHNGKAYSITNSSFPHSIQYLYFLIFIVTLLSSDKGFFHTALITTHWVDSTCDKAHLILPLDSILLAFPLLEPNNLVICYLFLNFTANDTTFFMTVLQLRLLIIHLQSGATRLFSFVILVKTLILSRTKRNQ